MAIFDVSKEWHILAPASVPAARNAADELAWYISLLRGRAGLDAEQPPIEDAETGSPVAVPVILLAAAAENREQNGFTWRLGRGRLEINGSSGRGLWKGVFDFLAALGVHWPRPGEEELPSPPSPGAYPLKTDRSYFASASSASDRRRLVIREKTTKKELESLIRWAARNQYDALVFSLSETSLWNKIRRGKGIYAAIEHYALVLEAGGQDLSLLLPRRLFFLHRDLFRMDSGRRVRQYHFCPTNPQTITHVKAGAEALFLRALPGITAQSVKPVLHLWPDKDAEKTWCACPACRAFSPAEQYRIAVNTAADVLAGLEGRGLLSFFKPAAETVTGEGKTAYPLPG
jgi:hypothetical protein